MHFHVINTAHEPNAQYQTFNDHIQAYETFRMYVNYAQMVSLEFKVVNFSHYRMLFESGWYDIRFLYCKDFI